LGIALEGSTLSTPILRKNHKMKKNNLTSYCFKIGVITISLKVILVGLFIIFFSKGLPGNQNIIYLIHGISVVALAGVFISIAAAFKGQWSWRLPAGFFLNLIALMLYPFVYTV